MKVLLGAAVAVMLMTATASAQTEGAPAAPTAPAGPPAQSECGVVPERPTLPDGASADRAGMDAGNAAFTEWGNNARAILQCRRQEVLTLGERRESLAQQFNAGAEVLNSTNAAWEAEVTEFNARGNNNRRR